MADFYHNDSIISDFVFDKFPLGDDIGLITKVELESSETNCFSNPTLEAVPSRMGQLFLIALYSFTSFIALIGNITVIVVELYGSESALNIRKYLINLSVSDIILGVVCVPFTYTDFMLGQWIFPHWLCPTAQYVQLLSVFVTSLTLTIIGVERYMATLHPFSSTHRWLVSHTHLMLIFTWVFGSIYAFIPYENTYTRSFMYENKTYYECSYDNELSQLKRRFFMTSNFLLTFLLPLIVLIASYSAIMRKLMNDQRRSNPMHHHFNFNNQHQTQNSGSHSCNAINDITETDLSPAVLNNSADPISSSSSSIATTITSKRYFNLKLKSQFLRMTNLYNSNNNNNNNNTVTPTESNNEFNLRTSAPINHRSKTIKMMFIIILLYGVCWMPIKLYQFLLDYGYISYCAEWQLYALVTTYFTCHWVAMSNSFVNPIVYSFMSKSFRKDLRKITKTFRATFRLDKHQSSLQTASTQV